jgi:hypothetical protein
MLRASICLIFCLLSIGLSAIRAAAQDVLECRFPTIGNNMGYLPDTVVLAYEPGNENVTVADPFIQSVKGGPIDLKIAEESAAKLSISWPLMLQSRTNTYIKMQYRISIQKRSLAASLTGRPQGFSNTFTAQGTCKRLQG